MPTYPTTTITIPQDYSSDGSSAGHTGMSMDDTINIVFGILTAVLGLITIYQAARFAALHARVEYKSPLQASSTKSPSRFADDAYPQSATGAVTTRISRQAPSPK